MNFRFKRFLPTSAGIKAASKYLAFGGAVFAVGLVWNFPLERISETFTDQITRATGYRISMDTLDPALPIGVKATNVRIQGAMKNDLEFSELKMTISPFSLLTYPLGKGVHLSLDGEQGPNAFQADVRASSKLLNASVETRKWQIDRTIELGELNPMLAGMNVKTQGVVAGEVVLSSAPEAIQRGDLTTAEGKFILTATKALIEIPVYQESRFVTQPLRFDKIEARGTIKQGKLEIESISLAGPDLSGTGKGSITISSYFPRSQIELDAKLQISDRAADLRQMVQTYGSFLGLHMDETGTLALSVKGMLDQPEVSGF